MPDTSEVTIEAAVSRLLEAGLLRAIPPGAGYAFLKEDVTLENRSEKTVLALVLWEE